MALSTGNVATWADMTRIYNRIRSEEKRWRGSEQTAIPNASAGSLAEASHGTTLRTALINLCSISFLNANGRQFSTHANASSPVSAGVLLRAVAGEAQGSTDLIQNLRANLNAISTVYGAFVASCGFGTMCTSYGCNKQTVSNSVYKNTNSYTGTGWYFNGAWQFFYNGDTGFTHTQVNSSHVLPVCSSHCTANYASCAPFCTAGFCTSYFTETL